MIINICINYAFIFFYIYPEDIPLYYFIHINKMYKNMAHVRNKTPNEPVSLLVLSIYF